jgi:NTP pyrophosphatase (non-canonical NTP hydrolase)
MISAEERERCIEVMMRNERESEMKVRPSVQWFAQQMEMKLQENDHKQHWSECDSDYLISRMEQEMDELLKALIDYRFGKGTKEEVIKEAADVANFAHMIADNMRGHPSIDRRN